MDDESGGDDRDELKSTSATSCRFLNRKIHAVKQCHVMTSEQLLLALYYPKFLNIVFFRSSSQYLQLKTINSVLRKI